MRELLRHYRHDTMRDLRISLAVALAVSPIVLPVSASALDIPNLPTGQQEQDSANDTENQVPAELQLSTGVPSSTTPRYIQPDGAKLTWSPTGSDGVQDTYDVLLSTSPEVGQNGAFSGEIIRSDVLVSSAEYDLAGLVDAQYYWQVRSCSTIDGCSDWSEVYPVTIDGVAPSLPSVHVTGGQYDTMVSLGGTSDAGTSITANIAKNVCTTTAAPDGAWSCQFSRPQSYGSHTATVVAADEAGNESQSAAIEFLIKELFVAPKITDEELPQVLNIVPVNDKPENAVFKQPISVVDSVTQDLATQNDEPERVSTPILTTDGGIVQASESGWQVVGLPWFVWLGGIGGALAGWRAFGSPVPRAIGGIFSL